jgi:hypothetical protein
MHFFVRLVFALFPIRVLSQGGATSPEDRDMAEALLESALAR